MWLLTPGLRRIIMFNQPSHMMRLLYIDLMSCIATVFEEH